MDKLDQLTLEGNFRGRVKACLEAVAYKHDPDPEIAEADRSPERQKRLKAAGFSRTLKSNHIGRNFKDGKARAADVTPEDLGWNASKRFWLLLGSAAWAMGIGWGGLFGLKGKQKKAVKDAIVRLRSLGWPKESHHYEHIPIGWDPAHLEKPVNW